jgi:photosynthetic reaction center H subunit
LVAGRVTDVWVDRSEPQIRYLEAEVSRPGGTRSALIPITLRESRAGDGISRSTRSWRSQFADVPRP